MKRLNQHNKNGPNNLHRSKNEYKMTNEKVSFVFEYAEALFSEHFFRHFSSQISEQTLFFPSNVFHYAAAYKSIHYITIELFPRNTI